MIDAIALRRTSPLNNPRALAKALNLDRGWERFTRGCNVLCPVHAENTASCTLFGGDDGTVHVHCKGCGWHGDALSLLAVVHGLDVTRDFPRVLEIATQLTGGVVSSEPTPARAPTLQSDSIDDEAHHRIWTAVLERCSLSRAPYTAAFLDRRGIFADAQAVDLAGYPDDAHEIVRDLIQTFERVDLERAGVLRTDWQQPELAYHGLGFRLIVPWRDQEGKIVFCQLRTLDDRKDKYRSLGGRRARTPFGIDVLADALAFHGPEGEVIVCEGALDALARRRLARERGERAAVIAISSASSPLEGMPFDLLVGRRVALATDDDDAGNSAARQIRDALPDDADVVRARPIGAKDFGKILEARS